MHGWPPFLSDAHTWANCSFIPSWCSELILTWRRSVDFHFPDDRHLSQFSPLHFYHMNLALLFRAFSSSNSFLAFKYLLSPTGNNFILYQKPRLIISLLLPPSLHPFCLSITLFYFYPSRTLRSRQTRSQTNRNACHITREKISLSERVSLYSFPPYFIYFCLCRRF